MAAVTNELPNAANPRDTVLDAARNNDRAVNGVEVISMSEPVEVQGSDYETEGAGTFYPEKVVGPVTPDGKDTYPAAEDGKYRYVVLYNWSAGGRFTELEVYTCLLYTSRCV